MIHSPTADSDKNHFFSFHTHMLSFMEFISISHELWQKDENYK